MFRALDIIANATPKDYLSHAPKDPEQLALQMVAKAQRLWPQREGEFNEVVETNYSFLYIGPGSGSIIKMLIDEGHIANGLETSKRGISSADPLIVSYINWSKPWETPYKDKYFHIALLSKYLKELLNADEWQATVNEVKRVSKYSALI